MNYKYNLKTVNFNRRAHLTVLYTADRVCLTMQANQPCTCGMTTNEGTSVALKCHRIQQVLDLLSGWFLLTGDENNETGCFSSKSFENVSKIDPLFNS